MTLKNSHFQTAIAFFGVVIGSSIALFGIYEFRSCTNIEYNTAIKNGEIFFGLKEFDKAKESFLIGIKEKPKDSYCKEMLNKCNLRIEICKNEESATKHFTEGKYHFAYSYYNELCRLDPDNQEYKNNRNTCRLKAESPSQDESRKFIEQVNNGNEKFEALRVHQPIDNIFKAWSMLDINLYMAQWSIDAVQHSKKFNTRNYNEILQKRQSFFKQLSSVNILNYNIYNPKIIDDDHVILLTKYSMEYMQENGRKMKELGIVEKYTIKYDHNQQKWLIIENLDYLDYF